MVTVRPPRPLQPTGMTPGEWAYFLDQPLLSEETFTTVDHWTNYRLNADRDLGNPFEGYAERRWHECEVAVLATWVQMLPGTRPKTWWRFSAPEGEAARRVDACLSRPPRPVAAGRARSSS